LAPHFCYNCICAVYTDITDLSSTWAKNIPA
jgi:hypothetical protein